MELVAATHNVMRVCLCVCVDVCVCVWVCVCVFVFSFLFRHSASVISFNEMQQRLKTARPLDAFVNSGAANISSILAERAIALSVTLSGGALFAN
jgi:hypothetical protein